MKKNIINIVLIFSSLFSIGLDGVNIPYENSNLSLSSTGIASESNIFLNPAVIHKTQESSVGFSYNILKFLQNSASVLNFQDIQT